MLSMIAKQYVINEIKRNKLGPDCLNELHLP